MKIAILGVENSHADAFGGFIKNNPEKYKDAGYVTNALEGGHVQTPGRYVPAMGKKLKANRVKGKYMYRKTAAELPQIAERGAQEIEKKAMAYLEGKG